MKLNEQEISEQMSQCSGWERDGLAIAKTYSFGTFMASVAFVNQIADIAEEIDHHPDIHISYDKVTLSVYTHSKGGLTALDFELARQANQLGG